MKKSIQEIKEICEKEGVSTSFFFEKNSCFLDTFSGRYLVKYIDKDLWVHTSGNCGFGNSWCCHSGTLIEVN